MKYLALALAFLLASTAHAADILTDYSTGLQACWDLDETSGTRLDATANNNDLTDNNTVLTGTGKYGNAADFESANSESLSILDASITGIEVTGTTDITISAWVNMESAPSDMMIAGKYNGGSAEAYALRYRNSGGLKIDWQTNAGGGASGGNQCTWSVDLGTSAWHHVFLFADMSETSATLWIDGVSQGLVDCGTENSIGNNSAPFRLGSGNATQYFDGLMDVVAIWTGDRSSNVSGVYNSGAGIACVAPAAATKRAILFFD